MVESNGVFDFTELIYTVGKCIGCGMKLISVYCPQSCVIFSLSCYECIIFGNFYACREICCDQNVAMGFGEDCKFIIVA